MDNSLQCKLNRAIQFWILFLFCFTLNKDLIVSKKTAACIAKSLGPEFFYLFLFGFFLPKSNHWDALFFFFLFSPFRVGKINAMGQEAEPNLKLELVVLINQELEQTHRKYRKWQLKNKSNPFNFRRKTVPEFLDLAKQGRGLVFKFIIV